MSRVLSASSPDVRIVADVTFPAIRASMLASVRAGCIQRSSAFTMMRISVVKLNSLSTIQPTSKNKMIKVKNN